ncbi:DUF2946 domain-containing protein [Methylobacillus arboreus]|uniref:DUF2946 domain-containing protein n=1 Tax=Methylobacillus arboreus TaxID=755170 RepID=UPI002286EBD7|nr:DUF2946 domain-containing protein [Methylobacillus arboreus]MCB5190395.1 DUF2946 domain-containing protein [Methylobacillus arboreus]
MILFRQKRGLIAWWICILLMFSALAPTLSHAFTVHGTHNTSEVVCSAPGSKYMPLSAKTADPAQPQHEHGLDMKYCPYCNLLHHSPVFAANEPLPPYGGHLGHMLPALYPHAPKPLFAWAAIRPRGPPANA